jgi:hypothetical protein
MALRENLELSFTTPSKKRSTRLPSVDEANRTGHLSKLDRAVAGRSSMSENSRRRTVHRSRAEF